MSPLYLASCNINQGYFKVSRQVCPLPAGAGGLRSRHHSCSPIHPPPIPSGTLRLSSSATHTERAGNSQPPPRSGPPPLRGPPCSAHPSSSASHTERASLHPAQASRPSLSLACMLHSARSASSRTTASGLPSSGSTASSQPASASSLEGRGEGKEGWEEGTSWLRLQPWGRGGRGAGYNGYLARGRRPNLTSCSRAPQT